MRESHSLSRREKESGRGKGERKEEEESVGNLQKPLYGKSTLAILIENFDHLRFVCNSLYRFLYSLATISVNLGVKDLTRGEIESRREHLRDSLSCSIAQLVPLSLMGRSRKQAPKGPTCPVVGCTKTFNRQLDVVRHKREVHDKSAF